MIRTGFDNKVSIQKEEFVKLEFRDIFVLVVV